MSWDQFVDKAIGFAGLVWLGGFFVVLIWDISTADRRMYGDGGRFGGWWLLWPLVAAIVVVEWLYRTLRKPK